MCKKSPLIAMNYNLSEVVYCPQSAWFIGDGLHIFVTELTYFRKYFDLRESNEVPYTPTYKQIKRLLGECTIKTYQDITTLLAFWSD